MIKKIDPESNWYVCIWIFTVTIIWSVFVFGFEKPLSWHLGFTVLGCFVIGVLSLLSPVRALVACSAGIFVILFYAGAFFHILYPLAIMDAVSGLFGMAGAIVRKLVMGQAREIHLEPWQWTFLIVGTVTLADFIMVFYDFAIRDSQYVLYLQYGGFSALSRERS